MECIITIAGQVCRL